MVRPEQHPPRRRLFDRMRPHPGACEPDKTTAWLNVLWNLLPKGKLADYLRRTYYRHRNHSLYALNDAIQATELLPGGGLRVTFKDGARFVAPEPKEEATTASWLKYADPKKWNKMRGFDIKYGHFVAELCGYVDDEYLKFWGPREGDVVVDLGAHMGTWTVKFARIVGPSGLVIAVEPDKDNVSRIKNNLQANGLTNVKIVQKGAWSRKETLRFWLYPDTAGHSFVNVESHNRGSIEIPVESVDDILSELGISKVNFIKMNIEGSELEAIKGMASALKTPGIKMSIGAHHVIDGKETHEIIPPILKKAGLSVRVKWKTVYAWRDAN